MKSSDPLLLADGTLHCGMYPSGKVAISRFEASEETNETSTERADTQLFDGGKFKGVALLEGLHAHLLQKDIEKYSKSNGAKSGRKKNNLANLVLIS